MESREYCHGVLRVPLLQRGHRSCKPKTVLDGSKPCELQRFGTQGRGTLAIFIRKRCRSTGSDSVGQVNRARDYSYTTCGHRLLRSQQPGFMACRSVTARIAPCSVASCHSSQFGKCTIAGQLTSLTSWDDANAIATQRSPGSFRSLLLHDGRSPEACSPVDGSGGVKRAGHLSFRRRAPVGPSHLCQPTACVPELPGATEAFIAFRSGREEVICRGRCVAVQGARTRIGKWPGFSGTLSIEPRDTPTGTRPTLSSRFRIAPRQRFRIKPSNPGARDTRTGVILRRSTEK